MAGDTRSLFESGDRLENALRARQRAAIADADQYDELLAYLTEWQNEPIINGTPGGERMWQHGGSGTPQIPEFAVCEIAAALGLSPTAAGILVGDLLDLQYRLPALFDALHEGVVEAWRVRRVASATRDFTITQAAEVDRRLSAETTGDGTPMLCRVTRSRLRQILDQTRNKTRPKDADDDTRQAADERTVRIRPLGSGVAAIDGLLSGEDGHRLDQRLDQIVSWLRALGDERGTGVLRAVAMGYLTEPDSLHLLHDQVTRIRTKDDSATGDENDDGVEADTDPTVVADAFIRERRRKLPRTVVYLHLDRASGTWSMDGTGPITRTEARDIIGHSHVTLKPMIDLAQNLTYTGYIAPPRLKEQTALQNAGLCTFPSCNRPARTADYDHLIDYTNGGPTSTRNGHRLCRYHHRCKPSPPGRSNHPHQEPGSGNHPTDATTSSPPAPPPDSTSTTTDNTDNPSQPDRREHTSRRPHARPRSRFGPRLRLTYYSRRNIRGSLSRPGGTHAADADAAVDLRSRPAE